MTETIDSLDLLDRLLKQAKAAGAEAADALYAEGTSLSVARRLGAPEKLERAEGADLGLRVLIGAKQAIVSSSDTGPEALTELVERAVAMARAVPDDPYCGIAEPAQLATDIPELDMFDPTEPSAETLVDWAAQAEDAARAVPGVTNSEGAEADFSAGRVTLAATNGFARGYASSGFSVSASVLAGEGTGMERDYDFSSAVHAADLESPEAVGRKAGEKAVKRLGPRKVQSGKASLVYDPRVSRGLLSHLASAVNGAAIARKTSFLMDQLGEQVFANGVTIVDDPHRAKGLRSKPFDGEGIGNRRRNLIEDGRLTTWLMDLRSSRQLELETTGHAARGTSSPPSPSATNLYMEPGALTPAELMADIKSGFYVTELVGFGINGLTGDYSRGAAGFWIENGEIAYPVSEVTVADNLKEMFKNLTPANDLEFRYGTDAPTIRIDGMTVAGR
jgi:PmbA protein